MAAGHGFIIPVGGAEEKIGDVTILRRFASLCGPGGRIAIIPTASELSDTGHRYEASKGEHDKVDLKESATPAGAGRK